MKCDILFNLLLVFFLMTSSPLQAETGSGKHHSLEEMSSSELKEALRKSHSEIESRLGPTSTALQGLSESAANTRQKNSSLSDKRAYETSAQNQIDLLSYKIRSLESSGNKNWGYSQNDAYKLRDIQDKARDQLNKMKSNNTEGWKTNKQNLESLLRSASHY